MINIDINHSPRKNMIHTRGKLQYQMFPHKERKHTIWQEESEETQAEKKMAFEITSNSIIRNTYMRGNNAEYSEKCMSKERWKAKHSKGDHSQLMAEVEK